MHCLYGGYNLHRFSDALGLVYKLHTSTIYFRCINSGSYSSDNPVLQSEDILYFQHPFVSGSTNKKPIIELISEAKAEVVIEEKDLDDSDIKVSKKAYSDIKVNENDYNIKVSKTDGSDNRVRSVIWMILT